MERHLAPAADRGLQNRLTCIEGHVRGIRRMLDEGQDCESVVMQLAAVRAALNQVTLKLLEAHLQTCLRDCAASDESAQALKRLQRTLVSLLKSA